MSEQRTYKEGDRVRRRRETRYEKRVGHRIAGTVTNTDPDPRHKPGNARDGSIAVRWDERAPAGRRTTYVMPEEIEPVPAEGKQG